VPLRYRIVVRALCLVIAIAGCHHGPRPSQAEREELAKFLVTMDHDQSLFSDTMQQRLVVRDGLDHATLRFGNHPVIEVEANAVRYYDNELVSSRTPASLNLPQLSLNLTVRGSRLANAIEAGRLPHRGSEEDAAQVRERVYIVIAADSRWEDICDVLDVVDDAGFMQPLLVFARTPATPPAPRTWVDDQFEAAAPDHRAETLTALFKQILGDCEPVRAAMAPQEPPDVAGKMLRSIAAAIRSTDCRYDLPALRSALWILAGDRQPRGVLALHLDRSAPAFELPAATLWRDAAAKVDAAKPPSRLVTTEEHAR
jgi:hypothetical protein